VVEEKQPETVQTAIRLPREMHERLKKGDAGVSEEIRRRLARTFAEDQIDPRTRLLMLLIGRLAELLKLDTNCDWFDHAAANRAFRQAVMSLLASFGRPSGEALFAPGELPARRLVESDDPTTIGVALAAMVFHDRPLTDDERRKVREEDAEARRAREAIARGEGPFSSLLAEFEKGKGGKS
jgi:hypothetical protein